MRLTRSGYICSMNQDIRQELTVRPIVNTEFTFKPPAFKVFKQKKDTACVPRFWGEEKYGPPTEDVRAEPAKMSVKFEGKLRRETHQIEAHDLAVSRGHGIISLPCGYGKTTVALAIACTLGVRTMIVVHKEFLANQWRERIKQFVPGASIGLVQQNTIDTEHDFVIAMLQSLSMKEYPSDTFDSIGCVIVDEAHHICAQVFSQSLFKMCPKYVYGLSATPLRKDGLTKVLHWFMGDTIIEVERSQEEKVLVKVQEYNHPMFKELPPTNRTGKLSLVQMITDLVECPERNEMIVKIVKNILKTKTRQLLILSERRQHCEWIHEKFPDISGLYMGGMSEEQLQESSKKTIVIGTYTLAHEGLDIPTLDTLILATPKSDVKQSIGRIMRGGAKNPPIIYDIRDNWSILCAMFYKRRKVYLQGGYDIKGDESPEKKEEPPLKSFSFLTHHI